MEQLLSTLGINWQLLLSQIVNFGILLFILTRFLYRPILKMIDERREAARTLQKDLEAAERQRAQDDQIRSERLRQADAEAGIIIEAAHQQAEKLHAEAIVRAKKDAERLVARGRRQIAQERADAIAGLQSVVSMIVVHLTETLLRREFGAADRKRMLKEISEKIPALLP